MKINISAAENQPAAQKEIDCIMYCSVMLEIHLEKGNFAQAFDLTQDISKSVIALQRIIKEKENNKKLNSIVVKLKSLGVNSSIVTRHFGDKKKLSDSAKSSALK